jgi:hypothetical protein
MMGVKSPPSIATATPISEYLCRSVPASVHVTLAAGTCCNASASALMAKSLTESLYERGPSFGDTEFMRSRARSSSSRRQSTLSRKCGMVCFDRVRRWAITLRMLSCGMTS